MLDVDEKYPGYTHFALTVSSMNSAKQFMSDNVIEIDAYGDTAHADTDGYSAHPA